MYFAGGASLAVATAAAGINAVINLNDASDCETNARRLRVRASEKRTNAESLRSKKASLSSEMTSLKSEIEQLEDITSMFICRTGINRNTLIIKFKY